MVQIDTSRAGQTATILNRTFAAERLLPYVTPGQSLSDKQMNGTV
jgi:hypothetical protein